jgi:transcriptional regulator with XRE-family HTH domain
MKDLGSRIVFIRKELKLTMQELADKLGVTKNAISKLENGTSKNLKMEHLYKLQDISGFSSEWIAIGRGSMRIENDAYHVDISHLSEESQFLITTLIRKLD